MTSVSEAGRVEFSFYRPGVTDVKVVGSFDQWAIHGTSMSDVGDGWWRATIELPAGEYRFRYVADGNWFTDFASYGVEFTKRGWNSILNVRPIEAANSMRIQPAAKQYMPEAVAA